MVFEITSPLFLYLSALDPLHCVYTARTNKYCLGMSNLVIIISIVTRAENRKLFHQSVKAPSMPITKLYNQHKQIDKNRQKDGQRDIQKTYGVGR